MPKGEAAYHFLTMKSRTLIVVHKEGDLTRGGRRKSKSQKSEENSRRGGCMRSPSGITYGLACRNSGTQTNAVCVCAAALQIQVAKLMREGGNSSNSSSDDNGHNFSSRHHNRSISCVCVFATPTAALCPLSLHTHTHTQSPPVRPRKWP